MLHTAQRPIDVVYTWSEAIDVVQADPLKSAINLAEGELPMPTPWEPRLTLDRATRYVHPGRERITRLIIELG